MLFLEILLSIHCLLYISSKIIATQCLVNQPSLKLKLARILLVSCIISPILVHCLGTSFKPERQYYVSIDRIHDYVDKPILESKPYFLSTDSVSSNILSNIRYYQLFYALFTLIILFRLYRLVLDLTRLQSVLSEAIPYRASKRLIIKVSQVCNIPFSVFVFNKAYIVLPLSLFSSSKNVKIAIAHEGQHLRNGDCLWAYLIEALRVFFFGNPGVTRWHHILSELQECSCDEVLVGHPKISAHDYGRCLFDVVQAASHYSLSSSRELACTVGMAVNNEKKDSTFIIRRINMLSKYSSRARKSLILGIVAAGFSILIPICAAYSAMGTLTGSQGKEIDTSHLDPKLQQIAEKEIQSAVNQYHAKSGVIAIADPATGTIIAFAESGKNMSNKSWKTRIFSPGSTIKPFIAAAAIDSGHSFETKHYDCHKPYFIEGRTFSDNSLNPGSITLTDALAQSSNVCFIQVAQEAGAAQIRTKLSELGLDMNSWWQANQNQNLQLAMASHGENIPVSIGSLTQSYAILANKGRLFDQKGTQVISEKTAQSLTHMLEHAVKNGTGTEAYIPGIAVAGKTGTVEKLSNASSKNQLALFAGYVPAKDPRYVILVILEDGYYSKKGERVNSGGELAAPVFRRVVLDSLANTQG